MSNTYKILNEQSEVINRIVADEAFMLAHFSQGSYVFEPPIKDNAAEAQKVRIERDILLAKSDTMLMADRWASLSAEQQSAWAAYRQALRDAPGQPGFPYEVQWPIQPE